MHDKVEQGTANPSAHGFGRALPRHIGIIMDGNGRWATARGLPRMEGHRRGVEAVRRTVRAALERGTEFLTIYSFSTENWSRPSDEVSFLMGLLRRFIRNDLAELHSNGVRVRVIGSREGVEPDIVALLSEAEELTKANRRLTLVIAFNYGSRQEIAQTMQHLAARVARGQLSAEEITPALISASLETADFPDPDLIIRTSGEQRLSNFLMWQAAYAEFVFLPMHWPDFDRAAFDQAISEYLGRERRFGGLGANAAKTGS
jgi:undecaprenyl diphosphate synthase